mmetsp:Transcript_20443/g.64317  ORF Transcript_20443/g.64317 Transcript_20443/m.64317 type:complete len:209 (+) Transcript_20443:400-1026(+)
MTRQWSRDSRLSVSRVSRERPRGFAPSLSLIVAGRGGSKGVGGGVWQPASGGKGTSRHDVYALPSLSPLAHWIAGVGAGCEEGAAALGHSHAYVTVRGYVTPGTKASNASSTCGNPCDLGGPKQAAPPHLEFAAHTARAKSRFCFGRRRPRLSWTWRVPTPALGLELYRPSTTAPAPTPAPAWAAPNGPATASPASPTSHCLVDIFCA